MKMGDLSKVIVLFCVIFLVACGGKTPHQEDVIVEAIPEPETTSHSPSVAETSDVVNYLGATASIDFDGVAYKLAWSHPPQGVYYIQEYMPDGQIIDKYEDIFIVDLFKDANTSIKAAVKEKTNWLDKRKSSDPMTNYKVKHNEKTGEYMVDLIISDGDIVEWNVIRYAAYEEGGKYAGVKAFTMSKRGYTGMDGFVRKMQPLKSKAVKHFIELPFPAIKPQK